MNYNLSSLPVFIGHCHLLLVHLPIGALALLGFLELLSCVTRWKNLSENSPWILGFICITLLASITAGWILSRAGEYDSHVLKRHRELGLALTATCLFAFLLRRWASPWFYRASLCTTLLLLFITGHSGGSMSHGSSFLTSRKLPGQSTAKGTAPLTRSTLEQPVFAGIIEPILQHRCCSCHGPEKHKADLRLDDLAALLRGGQDGPVIKPGYAKDSALVQCMLSPLDSDGHMPPEDQPQATAEEIGLIEWWIDAGAGSAQKLSDWGTNPQIRRLLELVSKQPESAK